jgi:hypothetical protein
MAFGDADQASQDPLLMLADQTQELEELAAIPSRIRLPVMPGHPKKGQTHQEHHQVNGTHFQL